jgi:enoyl-CoA hydratase/carnithine racemase
MTKVLYEKRGQIAYITLNRPEVHNAIDTETDELLFAAWSDFRDDPDVRVAILTGSGDRSFCAGADLAQRRTRTRAQPAGQGVRRPDHPRAAPNA